jgi:hypothetical protein
MIWECSECGGLVERRRPPALCRHCGTAGVFFVPAEQGLESAPEAGSLREAWLLAGLGSELALTDGSNPG